MQADENGKPIISESEMEDKVASKLVQMLVSKGVSKIIKKYGYLPVDYLKNEKKDKNFEMMMDQQAQSKMRRASSSKRRI